MALISWPNCVSFILTLFSLLTLILGPGQLSFTGSDSGDKVCFLGTGFRVMPYFFGPGFRDKNISVPNSGLRSRVCFFHWLCSESGCSVIGWFPAQGLVGSVH